MLRKFSSVIISILVVSLTLSSVIAEASKRRSKKKSKGPIETSLIVEGKSGKILHARNARKKIYPASLTKVMTLYLLFESLESGKLSLNQNLYVSKYATKALPSKLYVKAGQRIKVHDAILALSIKSANDVARVVAENIAGSEKKFARIMTVRARSLGMKSTRFTNASGWHDPKQVTTAVDLAKLSIAIKRDFPQYYHFFNKTSFRYKGKTVRGHNRVTATYPGATGLKTGFHTPAGCNLITAATRGHRSLVGVVTGRKSSAIRDKKMVQLLDKHFGVRTKKVKRRTKASKKRIKVVSGKNSNNSRRVR